MPLLVRSLPLHISKRKVTWSLSLRWAYTIPESFQMAPLTVSPPRALTFVSIDTETTGYCKETERVIEVGAVKMNSKGEIVGPAWSQLVRTAAVIPGRVQQITGISHRMLQDGKPIQVVLAMLKDYVTLEGPAPSCEAVVGHQIKFDVDFIRAECERNAVEFVIPTSLPQLCTLSLSRKLISDSSLGKKSDNGKNLDAACGHFGIIRTGSHRAASDAVATARLLARLIQQINKEVGVAQVSVAFLHLLSSYIPREDVPKVLQAAREVSSREVGKGVVIGDALEHARIMKPKRNGKQAFSPCEHHPRATTVVGKTAKVSAARAVMKLTKNQGASLQQQALF